MALPKFLQPHLASYDLSKLDAKRDKTLIITQVLNKGNYQALRWLGKTYSRKEIKKTIAAPTPGMWLKSTLLYWLKIFNFKLDKRIFNRAVLKLQP